MWGVFEGRYTFYTKCWVNYLSYWHKKTKLSFKIYILGTLFGVSDSLYNYANVFVVSFNYTWCKTYFGYKSFSPEILTNKIDLFARISFVNIDGIKGGFDTYQPKRKNRKNFDFKPLSDKFFMQIILYSAAFASKLRTCLVISKLIISENYS